MGIPVSGFESVLDIIRGSRASARVSIRFVLVTMLEAVAEDTSLSICWEYCLSRARLLNGGSIRALLTCLSFHQTILPLTPSPSFLHTTNPKTFNPLSPPQMRPHPALDSTSPFSGDCRPNRGSCSLVEVYSNPANISIQRKQVRKEREQGIRLTVSQRVEALPDEGPGVGEYRDDDGNRHHDDDQKGQDKKTGEHFHVVDPKY